MLFYANKHVDNHGRHEVHTSTCQHLPSIDNRVRLGNFDTCSAAITYAKSEYSGHDFDGCYYCCKSCHKG